MDFPRKTYEPITPNKDVVEFQITDIYVPENDKNKEKDYNELYTLLIYGTCENGATICVDIQNFTPYFYIKPPESWEELSDGAFENKVAEFKEYILSQKYMSRYMNREYEKKIIPKNMESHFKNLTIVRKKDFWGFTNNKVFRFMKVCVKSMKLYNTLKYYFKTLEKKGFTQYESNIDPFLKYLHIQDIKPCSWVRIEKYNINDDISRCDYNIISNHKNLIAIEKNKIAPILVTSFDIECSSSHGDFPVAKKTYSKVAQDLALVAKAGYECDEEFLVNWIQNIYLDDVIIEEATDLKINRVYAKRKITNEFIQNIPTLLKPFIGKIISILEKIASSVSDNCDDDNEDNNMTVAEINAEETKICNILDNILIPLNGDKIIQIGTTVHFYGSDKIVYKNIVSLDSCDDIEGCEVISCKTEKELLNKWKDVMNNLNSDIITGYNIFGFDMPYIWDRAKELNIIEEFGVGLGRLITRKNSLVEQQLSSSALGDNILKYIDYDGIVLVDLLKVMQRDQKLDS